MTGPTTNCIDPIKPLMYVMCPCPRSWPTLKVTRVTSAVSSYVHYNMLLVADGASSRKESENGSGIKRPFVSLL